MAASKALTSGIPLSQHHSRRALSALAITGLLASFAVTAPVSAASGAFTNPGTITINDADADNASGSNGTDIALGTPTGPGSVYPSTVDISAPATSAVNDLSVFISMTHENMDDVDLMLVSPSGKAVTLISDAGGDNPFEGNLYIYPSGSRFDDSGSINPGGYYSYGGPTDWDTTSGDSDAFPAPAPSVAPDNFASLYGTQANGTWSLYAVDDHDGSVGTIYDWSLYVDYSTPASPSPSTLAVTGLPKGITDVNLSLNNLNMQYLDDTEFVLESPDGRRAHVLSDAGGYNSVTGVTLSLDDEATALLRKYETPVTGTYQPVDFDDDDTSEFVGGFDTANLSSALSTFDGADPNGTWKLYVSQEYCCNTPGEITDGWSLQISTADATATPTITSPVNGSRDTDGTVTLTGTATAGALMKVTTGDKTRNTVADGGVWTVTFGDLADGSHTFTATATDSSGNVSAPATVTVTVDRVTPVEADTTAPKVRTVKPRKDEMRIDTSASAMVRFSEAMNVASVKRAVKLVSMETGKAVDTKLTYKSSKNRLTINPKQNLDRNTTYMVVVTRSAKDLAGNALLKTRKSIFNTL